MRLAACLLVAGCGFQHGALGDGGPRDGAVDDSPDGTPVPPGTFVVLHVPVASSAPGTGPLSIAQTVTIDTDALTIGGAAPPSGVTFDHVAQVPSGPQLAVLHVSTFTLVSPAVIRVIGSRPLVVIGSGDIAIHGIFDAGARNDQPGPGGGLPAMGSRPGVQGAHDMTYCDAGGGGGGHATAGGVGGAASGTGSVSMETCNAAGGTAGATGGDPPITVLAGGSGGGPGRGGNAGTVAACVAAGGGGGGAVQLSSETAIVIDGGFVVGGGGGRGGVGTDNTNCTNRGSGGGGGSAGSIVLQAPAITIASTGYVAALGGGGGGGATVGVNGGDGSDGFGVPGGGGASAGTYGAMGGVGGGTAAPATGGASTVGDGNGAGAGGAAGRIAVYHPASGSTTLSGTVSPTAYSGTY